MVALGSVVDMGSPDGDPGMILQKGRRERCAFRMDIHDAETF